MSEAKILATVAGKNITETDVAAFIQNLPREQQMYAGNPQFRAQVLDQLVCFQMLAQEGLEEKLDETEEYKNALAAAQRDILAQMKILHLMNSVSVSDEELAAYYEANKSFFTTGDKVGARHILVEAEDQCQQILADINAGKISFEDAAKEHSTCPSKDRGGDLGEFGRGQMVGEFEQAAFEADVDTVVGPVKTQFGYHLIKVYSRQVASIPAFEEVKDQAARQLLQEKKEAAYNSYMEELKKKYL